MSQAAASLLIALSMAASAAAPPAPDPWAKVAALATGSELHIFKKGSSKPVTGTFAEANDDNLIVFLKKEEVAIPREAIDRIDARPPAKSGGRATSETRTTVDPNPTPSAPIDAPTQGAGGPTTSTSTTFGSPSRPGFLTVYRRPTPAPVK